MARPVRTIFLSLLMLTGVSAHGDILEQNEVHFERITELKNQLEILELQQQIAKLNGALAPTPVPVKPSAAKALIPSDTIRAELMYIVNNGKSKKYTLRVNNSLMTLTSGQYFNGWRFVVSGDQLSFRKGNRTADVI